MSRSSAYWFKQLKEYFNNATTFERYLKKVHSLSLINGNYKAEFPVDKDDLNMSGELHEGLTTTLIDTTSIFALLTHGRGFLGASTNIHISHLQQAFPGDVLLINTKVCRVDDPLAFVEVDISRKNEGGVIARAQHTLFIKPSPSGGSLPPPR